MALLGGGRYGILGGGRYGILGGGRYGTRQATGWHRPCESPRVRVLV